MYYLHILRLLPSQIGWLLSLSCQLRVGVASKKVSKSSLEEISIRSLGVIESSNIQFKPGLTVLTGETGAGKTMVLTALGLVLGSKSDSDLVRAGQERAVVTGRFSVPLQIQDEILASGGEVEDDCVVITRTLSSQGKSRVLVGSAVSSAATVSSFALSLVEIHAQSSSSKLMKPAVSRELLDRYGGIDLTQYQEIFTQYQEISLRIEELKNQLLQRDKEIDLLTEFAQEFSKLSPVSGELVKIENEIAKLGSVEQLNQVVSSALNLLEDEDLSALNLLQQMRKSLDSVAGKDRDLDQITERFTESLLNLQDVGSDLTSYLSSLEADPSRFAQLQDRKSALSSLLKRYGKGSDKDLAFEELIADGLGAKQKLADLSGGSDRITELEKQKLDIFSKMKISAVKLANDRKINAEKLSKLVTSEIRNLSMPNSQFVISQSTLDSDKPGSYTAYGLDEIAILFAAHTGATPLPLSKVASGGELSRVMLALEVVIAEAEPIGTYIFDEVDAGVGGKAAVEIGRRLAKLSKSAQVIVITHLPQVAVWADNHLVVKKSESGSVTQSDVKEMSADERKVEIARMLSGQADSQTAQEHASELLTIVRQSMIS
ncbi:MAG: DNA repair protein RecN [Actinobacteria bacterium]|nr:DNA repair protein RecN [Actinomycetota bacterium]